MFTIEKKNTNLSQDKQSLVTFASDVNMPVGQWPDMIAVLDENNSGFLFMKERPILHNEEFGGYYYRTKDGAFGLTVFND
jgi:hypothetical protein